MADNIVIRPVGKDERAAWEPLWDGYIAFYKATLAPGVSDTTWQRFHDSGQPMFLLGAYVDGKLTGIVQFVFHSSTWSAADYCYLGDLFVAESARGLGLGRALIEAVYEQARAAGLPRVIGTPTPPMRRRACCTIRSRKMPASFSIARCFE
jgi:GNAT superfamily N-acetyltransferase